MVCISCKSGAMLKIYSVKSVGKNWQNYTVFFSPWVINRQLMQRKIILLLSKFIICMTNFKVIKINWFSFFFLYFSYPSVIRPTAETKKCERKHDLAEKMHYIMGNSFFKGLLKASTKKKKMKERRKEKQSLHLNE